MEAGGLFSNAALTSRHCWRRVAAAGRRPARCRVLVRAWDRSSPAVAVPAPSPEPPARPGAPVPLLLGLAAAAAAVAWQRLRSSGGSNGSSGSAQSSGSAYSIIPREVRPDRSEADEKEYRMALARTRQATAVHRAVGFMAAGSPTRAMVELRRALHENSVCRAPVLNTNHSRKELESLYRLHLQHAEVPSDFATLLQLRAMLDLGFEDAERIEAEVMQQGAAYSI